MSVTTNLSEAASRLFVEAYGALGDSKPQLFFAPGRANLLGAHMDYNGGVVMPVGLSRGTMMAVRPRTDGRIRLCSAQFPGEVVELGISELKLRRTSSWSAYAEGAIYFAYQAWGEGLGLDAAFCADLPMESGLSSSASIECVVVYAIARLLGVDPDPDEVIRLAHQAENEYVGVRCGILDQAAITLARENSTLLLDCLELTREYLPMPSDQIEIAVVDSGVQRQLGATAFNQRVVECTNALAGLQVDLPGLTCLRDLSRSQFEERRDVLSPVLQRRVEHVISEVERTTKGAAGLRCGDLAGFGACITGAHFSLRDNYEVSTPELDCLVETAISLEGCHGARLTGAGFGGCIVAIVNPAVREEFTHKVPAAYRKSTGRETEVMWFRPAGGTTQVG